MIGVTWCTRGDPSLWRLPEPNGAAGRVIDLRDRQAAADVLDVLHQQCAGVAQPL